MKKEYLPSKQFIYRVIIIAIIIVIVGGIYETVKYFRSRSQKSTLVPIVVKDIVQKDSNNNGIPDWEESLWGLDPTKNGHSNKEFILSKRQSLAEQAGTPVANNGNPVNENDKLAREFFAVIMSFQQNGTLDANSLQSISDAMGQKIIADPIPDMYTKSMASIRGDEPVDKLEYYTAYVNLNNKYSNKNIGDELTFMAAALKDNDPGALKIVGDIASSYKEYAKELMKIPVPSSLLSIHLDLANNYEKVGESLDGMTKVFDDGMTSMKAFVNYNKYSDLLVSDISKLSDNFN